MPDVAAGAVPLLIKPHFLTRGACERIRRAMDRGAEEPAEIIDGGIVARDTIRHTTSIDIEPGIREWFERRLDAFRPAIARAMRCALSDREGSGFLRYPPGGFYRTHRDRAKVAGWPAAARRAVSVVVFLNAAKTGNREGHFQGGSLCLYPAHGHPPVEVQPETGLLVAFQAEMLHEVLPVTAGIRDAAVDWFYDE